MDFDILNDIYKELKDSRSDTKKLTQEIAELKAKVNDPKPVKVDDLKMARGILSVLQPAFKGVESQLNHFSELASSIPKSVQVINKKVFALSTNTTVWLTIVVLSVLTTYFITPKIAQYRLEQQEIKISNLQFEVDYFRERNKNTAKSFDEKYGK